MACRSRPSPAPSSTSPTCSPRTASSGRVTRRSTAPLRTIEPIVTRSELEDRFYELVDEAGLPRPLVNQTVEGYEVDFFWPELDLIIETDGRDAHLTPTAFEQITGASPTSSPPATASSASRGGRSS